VFMEKIYFGTDVDDAFFVDSGLTYDSTATTTITGLNHLEGETVQILADGSAHADKTVSGGAITLDRSASTVHVGYSFTSQVQTLRLEGGADDGVSQGKIKRINELTVRLFRSVGLKVGRDANNLDIVPFRSSATAMDAPISLFTGDKEIELNGNYDTDGQLTIRQDQPLPMNILAVYATLSTFDQ